jgi:hypothetical protein
MMQPVRCLVVAFGLVVALYCPIAGAEGVRLSVFYRVLMIHTVNGQGTGFTLDVDGKQYLVTAKHMVTGLKLEDTIQVRKYDAAGNLKWVDLKMKIFNCDDPVDIAVLVPREQLTISGPLEPSGDGESPPFGQDVFFVGFPYGLSMEFTSATSEISVTTPFAYVRRAILSAMKSAKAGEVVNTEFISDGYNLGGFSGSPVVFNPNGNPRVIAVISGFRPDYGPVLTPQEIKPEEAKPEDYGQGRIIKKDSHTYRLEEPKDMKDERYVMLNTGIVKAWDIHRAVELIRQHPEGPKVDASFKPSLAQ